MSTIRISFSFWFVTAALVLLPSLCRAQYYPQFGPPTINQQPFVHQSQPWNLNPYNQTYGPRFPNYPNYGRNLNYPNYGGIRNFDFYNFGAPIVSRPNWFGGSQQANFGNPPSLLEQNENRNNEQFFLDFNQPRNLPMPHRPLNRNGNPQAEPDPFPAPRMNGIPPELNLLR